jgi:tetratricopeptide (TPR) repeat protein
MTQLIKIASWAAGVRLNVLFVHGLGGNAYDTWRCSTEGDTFWPTWLARDIPGLTTWTLAYEAPPTNWLGTAMPIQDRAKNVLECLLGCHELRGVPLVFVCHSLGGLVVKQVLRAADGRRAYSPETQAFLNSVKGVVFIATPHTGSMQATLLDKLRVIAWPSASTLDLVRNNANLRDLNIWYRNWSGAIRHKVFFEKQGTTTGIIVSDDSSDPGLLHVDPIGIDADHLGICKPADANALVYVRTRDFIVDEIIPEVGSSTGYGTFQAFDLPKLPRTRSNRFAPIALRLAVISIVGLLLFKGTEALFFPPDVLGKASVEQITAAILAKSPNRTPIQIEQFIDALRQARGDPSFERAVEEAKKGNTRVAEGIWRQIYENREKEQNRARQEQADAARNLAASTVINNVTEGLFWFRKATALDPNNMAGWLGLGLAAALGGGTLQESDQAFRRYVELARGGGQEVWAAAGLVGLGTVLEVQGKLDEALKSYRDSLAIFERVGSDASEDWQRALLITSSTKVGDVLLSQGKFDEALKSYHSSLAISERLAAADRSNTFWPAYSSDSYQKIGDVLGAQGKLDEALKSYRDSLAVAERVAASDRSNTVWQSYLSLSHGRIGSALRAQGKLDEALKSYRASLALAERVAAADPGNTSWQQSLSVSYQTVGDVLVAQGKLDEALKNYRSGLAIAERLASSERSNAVWQSNLSLAYGRIGNALVAQGKLDEALKSHRDGLAIAERVAASDRNNAGWQTNLAMAYEKVGDVLGAQGKLDQALKSYRDSLAVVERLASSDRGNPGWQRNLSVAYEKVGDVLLVQGKLDEALTGYRNSLAIRERLAASDPSNTDWRRDVSVAYSRLGDVLKAQGKLDEALKSHRDSLAIVENLTASDPSNTGWRRDLSSLYGRIGDVLADQGKVDEAFKNYRDSLAIIERLTAFDRSNTQWHNDLLLSTDRIGGLAYRFVLAGNFATALEACDLVIPLAPDELWLHGNRAHALMFLGRVDEARTIYLRNRGEKGQDGKPWETVVLEDFAEMRKAGLTHPLMDEIEKRFAAGG